MILDPKNQGIPNTNSIKTLIAYPDSSFLVSGSHKSKSLACAVEFESLIQTFGPRGWNGMRSKLKEWLVSVGKKPHITLLKESGYMIVMYEPPSIHPHQWPWNDIRRKSLFQVHEMPIMEMRV